MGFMLNILYNARCERTRSSDNRARAPTPQPTQSCAPPPATPLKSFHCDATPVASQWNDFKDSDPAADDLEDLSFILQEDSTPQQEQGAAGPVSAAQEDSAPQQEQGAAGPVSAAQETDAPREENEGSTSALCSYTKDGKMHLANAVTIPKATYDTLMAVAKDSHFVKRAASAIWSTDVLAQRSFTGTLSNRCLSEAGDKEPQQPLTPHKVEAVRVFFNHYASAKGYSDEERARASKNIRLWLSQKTSELRRKRQK
ncbi:uncharacterized protein LOC135372476 [Ornithodoros turicata]|uniref:uncharacterized protein LOC135372476 n=1 Tax=Ornithodoros turicata TaxID=34597 RepID=UPI003138805A